MSEPGAVPFVDLTTQLSEIRAEVDAAMSRVLDQGEFILGAEVALFEAEFARYCGTDHAVGVDSGFSALELALRALAPRGGEVITQANTFVATPSAIQQAGARPVLVDCDAEGRIDVGQMAHAVTAHTAALLPVHLYGRLADMAALTSLSERTGVPVIEDACQAHGATRHGRRAGSFGAAAAFSFYPGKNLGALGDGGMMTTSDAAIADWARAVRSYGQQRKYDHVLTPLNRRLDTLQAAVLSVKLSRLDAWNRDRGAAAGYYRELLADLPLDLPATDVPGAHVYHLFVVELDDRGALADHLAADGISTGIHYPVPVHLAAAMADLGYRQGQFPNAERRAQRQLSLPMYPELGRDLVERVAASIRRFFGD